MKITRHTAILTLIEQHEIETQDELTAYLQKDGIKTTQATVSRDIKNLGLVKVPIKDGRYKYAPAIRSGNNLNERFMQVFSHCVISIQCSGNLVVIKTIAGSANVAAEAIDSLNYPEVMGTIAGDNTIFIAVRGEEFAHEIADRFEGLMR